MCKTKWKKNEMKKMFIVRLVGDAYTDYKVIRTYGIPMDELEQHKDLVDFKIRGTLIKNVLNHVVYNNVFNRMGDNLKVEMSVRRTLPDEPLPIEYFYECHTCSVESEHRARKVNQINVHTYTITRCDIDVIEGEKLKQYKEINEMKNEEQINPVEFAINQLIGKGEVQTQDLQKAKKITSEDLKSIMANDDARYEEANESNETAVLKQKADEMVNLIKLHEVGIGVPEGVMPSSEQRRDFVKLHIKVDREVKITRDNNLVHQDRNANFKLHKATILGSGWNNFCTSITKLLNVYSFGLDINEVDKQIEELNSSLTDPLNIDSVHEIVTLQLIDADKKIQDTKLHIKVERYARLHRNVEAVLNANVKLSNESVIIQPFDLQSKANYLNESYSCLESWVNGMLLTYRESNITTPSTPKDLLKERKFANFPNTSPVSSNPQLAYDSTVNLLRICMDEHYDGIVRVELQCTDLDTKLGNAEQVYDLNGEPLAQFVPIKAKDVIGLCSMAYEKISQALDILELYEPVACTIESFYLQNEGYSSRPLLFVRVKILDGLSLFGEPNYLLISLYKFDYTIKL